MGNRRERVKAKGPGTAGRENPSGIGPEMWKSPETNSAKNRNRARSGSSKNRARPLGQKKKTGSMLRGTRPTGVEGLRGVLCSQLMLEGGGTSPGCEPGVDQGVCERGAARRKMGAGRNSPAKKGGGFFTNTEVGQGGGVDPVLGCWWGGGD